MTENDTNWLRSKQQMIEMIIESDKNGRMYVKGPYGHNIIRLVLEVIDKRLGTNAANLLIDDLNLFALGYSHKVKDLQ